MTAVDDCIEMTWWRDDSEPLPWVYSMKEKLGQSVAYDNIAAKYEMGLFMFCISQPCVPGKRRLYILS